MSTIHNSAKQGEIARTVIMPGDPLRAKYIAQTYLEDARLVNDIRCAFAFTGLYDGIRVSVMASGMGCGSMGIYSYELFDHYGVQNIIRVGSAGAMTDRLGLGDVVVALAASTDSGYAANLEIPGTFCPTVSGSLLKKAFEADSQGIFHYGPVLSTDAFYTSPDYMEKWRRSGVLATEMETFALYSNAAILGKDAIAILTITDIIGKEQEMSAFERQTGLNTMIGLALKMAKLS